MNHNRLTFLIVCAATLFLGCNLGDSSATFNGPPSGAGEAEAKPDPAVQTQEETGEAMGDACQMGKTYKGFGGRVLVAGRVEAEPNLDRFRIKPYSALKGEFARVLGEAPNLLNQMGGTFSQPPNRWYEEPQASAVTLYTAYRVGFVGCLDLTDSGDAFASAPDKESASAQCQAWARTFWSRTPTQAEVDACVKVATVDTTPEENPRRRWAYTCASLLSTAGFLSY